MYIQFPPLKHSIIGLTALVAAVMTASCASTLSSSPREVAANNPTVTYQYRNDDELIQANQRAVSFCDPYQSLPRAQHFSEDSDHQKVVIFECVAGTQTAVIRPAVIRQSDSELRYDYRSDQELLDVSRTAQVQCRNNGRPDVSSNVTVNSDGSRSVTFHCNPRA
jgi:hypothetical protein